MEVGGWGGGKAAKRLMGADLQAWAAWWGHMGSVACLGHGRPPWATETRGSPPRGPGGRQDTHTWSCPPGSRSLAGW